MQKVRVYWNLHKKCWSIQDGKSGLVIDHKHNLFLERAKFVVRKGGQKRVREEGKKMFMPLYMENGIGKSIAHLKICHCGEEYITIHTRLISLWFKSFLIYTSIRS